MFFHERARDVKYTVIHSRYNDGKAEWRLGEIAKTTGLTIEGGALYMGPAYIKSVGVGVEEHNALGEMTDLFWKLHVTTSSNPSKPHFFVYSQYTYFLQICQAA